MQTSTILSSLISPQWLCPLLDLLRTKGKDPKAKLPTAPLQWSSDCAVPFTRLKELFTSEPVLAHLDEVRQFIVKVNASDVAMGAVLLQMGDGNQLWPCVYLSKHFSETERNWPVWEKEAAAIKLVLSTWHHLLEGAHIPFEVWMDHKNLEALKCPHKLGAKQCRSCSGQSFSPSFILCSDTCRAKLTSWLMRSPAFRNVIVNVPLLYKLCFPSHSWGGGGAHQLCGSRAIARLL